ncbi:putative lactose permease [Meredithblackwellia eburnea MCA 4105]
MTHPISYRDLPNNTNDKWWRDAGLRKCVGHVVILYLTLFALGFDGSLLSGLQALNNFNRDFDYHWDSLRVTYYLPKPVISWVLPYFTDRFGRKIPLYFGAVLMVAGAAAGAASKTRADFMGARVLLGVGTAAGQIAGSSLIHEIAHPRIRPFCGSFLQPTYYVGSIMSSWLCFGMVYIGKSSWAWRAPLLAQGVGPLILLIGTYWVPQSPRWLVKNGRSDEAHEILANLHANGKMDDPLVLFEMKEIEAALETEKLAGTSSWMSFLNSGGGRRRLGIIMMIGLSTQWMGTGVVQYYLAVVLRQVGITDSAKINGINGALAIFNWICSLNGAYFWERFGRRPLVLTSLVCQLACFCVISGAAAGYNKTHHAATGLVLVPFIFLFMGTYSAAFTPLPLAYVPEVNPYSMRTKAGGILIMFQNSAQIFNQLANPIIMNKIGWKYLVYVASIFTFLVLFFFFLRETKGLTVEEASVVYDPADKREASLDAERKIRMAAEAALEEKQTGSVEHIEGKERV